MTLAEERRAEVSFQWKKPDFLLKNPDFLLRNADFTTKQEQRLERLVKIARKQRNAGEIYVFCKTMYFLY